MGRQEEGWGQKSGLLKFGDKCWLDEGKSFKSEGW